MSVNRTNENNKLILHGTNYGGFYYPKNLPDLDENSVIYCFGAGEDITHDVILSSKLNCPVYIFDPTPRAIEHVKYVKDVLSKKTQPKNNKRFGGGDPNYWNLILNNQAKPENIILHEYGLYTKDDTLNFYLPNNSEYVSCSLDKRGRSNKSIDVPVKTLNTIMNELNHSHIDLLKIDIENVECDVLEKMLEDKIYPRYLSVDFDLMNHDKNRCHYVINKLIMNDYKLIKNTGQDMTFIKNK
jgi:FkbM family methyltransferase